MARSAVFLVRLSRSSPLPVTVAYTTTPGTAVPPGDFTPTSGTITFAPGQTSAQIVVPIREDVTVPRAWDWANNVSLINAVGGVM